MIGCYQGSVSSKGKGSIDAGVGNAFEGKLGDTTSAVNSIDSHRSTVHDVRASIVGETVRDSSGISIESIACLTACALFNRRVHQTVGSDAG